MQHLTLLVGYLYCHMHVNPVPTVQSKALDKKRQSTCIPVVYTYLHRTGKKNGMKMCLN